MQKIRSLSLKDSGLGKKEWQVLKKLNSPRKIQDYLNKLPFNREKKGETYMSVGRSLKAGTVHCFEGALVAAAALWIHGERPFLVDFKTVKEDEDHVVVLFRRGGGWGAISKTNHAVLRYREPVYRDLRELAMSYFHEYFMTDGFKTLRTYSKPFDLSKKGTHWLTSSNDLIDMVNELEFSPHIKILTPAQVRNLRKADKIETDTINNTEYA